MSDFRVLKKVLLRGDHTTKGRTRQLEIAEFGEDPGYSLLHLDQDGKTIWDTWHETLDDAMAQAAREFGVKSADWV
jgi:hypothetical protein